MSTTPLGHYTPDRAPLTPEQKRARADYAKTWYHANKAKPVEPKPPAARGAFPRPHLTKRRYANNSAAS